MLIVIRSLAGRHGLWHPLESAVVGTPLLVETAPSILHIRHRSSHSASVSLALSLSVSQASPNSCPTVLFLQTANPSNVENLKTSTKQIEITTPRVCWQTHVLAPRRRKQGNRLGGGVSFSQIYEIFKSRKSEIYNPRGCSPILAISHSSAFILFSLSVFGVSTVEGSILFRPKMILFPSSFATCQSYIRGDHT